MNFCIKNQLLSVAVESLGAELQSINYEGKELLWQGNPAIWGERSPLLFPIVGRLKNDELKYNGKTYILKKHGFAAKKQFACTEHTEEKVSFELLSDDATKVMYPFDFKLNVIYSLDKNTLKVSYEVVNTGDKTMYFSIGGHPGFNCAIGDRIVFEKNETVERLIMNEDSYISERKLFLNDENEIIITEDLFSQDALIFEGLKSRYLTVKTKDRDIKVHFEGAHYLGIWAKPKSPYVCIEPWFGTDDMIDANCSFAEKEGIVSVESGNNFNYLFDIEIVQYNHYDNHGRKTGHSDPSMFGGYKHYDSKNKSNGSSSPNLTGGYFTPITLESITKDDINETDFHVFIKEELEHTQYLLLQLSEELSDISLSLMEITDEGLSAGETIYTLDKLNEDKPLVVGVVFYGDLNTYGLSFKGASEKDGNVVMEFKNIASYPMNFNADEITQRFVRGDESRTQEGNGLGLAIAKSYTEICNGIFDVVIDGDMFKAILTFRKYS